MDIKIVLMKRKAGNNELPFGKHKWESLKSVDKCDPCYLEWLMMQDWFENKFSYLYDALEVMGYEKRTEYIYDDLSFFDSENVPF